MPTGLSNDSPEQQDILGAEARAVIEADFKEIQPRQMPQKNLTARLRDVIGNLVNQDKRA